MTEKSRTQVLMIVDTTGSMVPAINQVKNELDRLITRGFREVPNLEVGIIVHGDYCDRETTYVTKEHQFNNNLNGLITFVADVRATGGGDEPECYELALRKARGFAWQDDAKKVIILIGDEEPHQKNYYLNTLQIDWVEEVKELARMGVVIHTIQALDKRHAEYFYRDLAGITGGKHFRLNQFRTLSNYLIGIVLSQVSQDAVKEFEREVYEDGDMDRGADQFFSDLLPGDRKSRFSERSTGDLVPVSPSRFQLLRIKDNTSIKEFVIENDLIFKTGRGFYEFTKTETIQSKKEVVLRDRLTGDMFTGVAARQMLGLPEGVNARLKPTDLERFQVFVQSTSYNRKLIGGTDFLYEVDKSR